MYFFPYHLIFDLLSLILSFHHSVNLFYNAFASKQTAYESHVFKPSRETTSDILSFKHEKNSTKHKNNGDVFFSPNAERAQVKLKLNSQLEVLRLAELPKSH